MFAEGWQRSEVWRRKNHLTDSCSFRLSWEHDGLLDVAEAQVNQAENEKPIDNASRMGYQEIATLFLRHGASLGSRNTAVHLASENGTWDW